MGSSVNTEPTHPGPGRQSNISERVETAAAFAIRKSTARRVAAETRVRAEKPHWFPPQPAFGTWRDSQGLVVILSDRRDKPPLLSQPQTRGQQLGPGGMATQLPRTGFVVDHQQQPGKEIAPEKDI